MNGQFGPLSLHRGEYLCSVTSNTIRVITPLSEKGYVDCENCAARVFLRSASVCLNNGYAENGQLSGAVEVGLAGKY